MGLSNLDFGNFQSTLSQLPLAADEKIQTQFQNRLDALYNLVVEKKSEVKGQGNFW